MRRTLSVGSLILSATLAASSIAAAPTIVGKDAPDFVLRGLDGRNLRLSEFRGQVVLVNFWTRSDGDSRQQMPALDRINITYQRAGLVVLGVSVDDDLRRSKENYGVAPATAEVPAIGEAAGDADSSGVACADDGIGGFAAAACSTGFGGAATASID